LGRLHPVLDAESSDERIELFDGFRALLAGRLDPFGQALEFVEGGTLVELLRSRVICHDGEPLIVDPDRRRRSREDRVKVARCLSLGRDHTERTSALPHEIKGI